MLTQVFTPLGDVSLGPRQMGHDAALHSFVSLLLASSHLVSFPWGSIVYVSFFGGSQEKVRVFFAALFLPDSIPPALPTPTHSYTRIFSECLLGTKLKQVKRNTEEKWFLVLLSIIFFSFQLRIVLPSRRRLLQVLPASVSTQLKRHAPFSLTYTFHLREHPRRLGFSERPSVAPLHSLLTPKTLPHRLQQVHLQK